MYLKRKCSLFGFSADFPYSKSASLPGYGRNGIYKVSNLAWTGRAFYLPVFVQSHLFLCHAQKSITAILITIFIDWSKKNRHNSTFTSFLVVILAACPVARRSKLSHKDCQWVLPWRHNYREGQVVLKVPAPSIYRKS